MKGYFTLFLLFFSLLNFSQEKIKAYIDCRCDENYLKQETSFLEYVRDQDLADVEIFIRDERNPTGSRSFEITIDGKSVAKDAKNIHWKFHPELNEEKMSKKDIKSAHKTADKILDKPKAKSSKD